MMLYKSLNFFTIINMKLPLTIIFASVFFFGACSTAPKTAGNNNAAATQTIYGTAANGVAQEKSAIVMYALGLHGTQYQWGGSTPQSGFDCSGFVRHVYKEAAGTLLPRSAYEMSQSGSTVGATQLQPGDLVFFNTLQRAFSHVGIYLGDNRFIHAPSAGKAVQISQMGDTYWKRRFEGARRLP